MYLGFFDNTLKERVSDIRMQLMDAGQLPHDTKLAQEYKIFQERFNPDYLDSLEGEAMLEMVFNPLNPDSLAHWLEYKNDGTFSSDAYGLISTDNTRNCLIFRREEDGEWARGQKQIEMTLDKALEIGGRIKSAIMRGAMLVRDMTGTGIISYEELQNKLGLVLDTRLEECEWIHKYYHLLYPNIIGTFHTAHFQQHLLTCMGDEPTAKYRLYVLTGQMIQRTRSLPMPTLHADNALKHLYGPPVSYYKIGLEDVTTGSSEEMWKQIRAQGCISIAQTRPHDPGYTIMNEIKTNDIIAVCDGIILLGIGVVTGPFAYQGDPDSNTQSEKIKWLFTPPHRLIKLEAEKDATIYRFETSASILKIRELAASGVAETEATLPGQKQDNVVSLPPLDKTIKSIDEILSRKCQIIIYGPPGTGKTYHAVKTACELASRKLFRKPFDALTDDEIQVVRGDGRQSGLVRMCCFHPSYGYEDFIEGIKPIIVNDNTLFEMSDGIFYKICTDAVERVNKDKNFYIIIDEINRGDNSRIFGELITLIEHNKRGTHTVLPISGRKFLVPPNVYIIGTMNTADRSIALLDIAMRRRFGFKELMPDYSLLSNVYYEEIRVGELLRCINKRICRELGRDARNLQIGHSFFMHSDKADSAEMFLRAMAEDVLPLVEEYCYGDYGKLAAILGEDIVDLENLSLRYELFDEERDKLKPALLSLMTT